MPDEEKETVSHETDEEKEPVSHETQDPKDEDTSTKEDSAVLAKLNDVLEKVDKVIDVVTVLAVQSQDVPHETEEDVPHETEEDTLEDYENLL